MDDIQLKTAWQQKRGKHRIINISEPLAILMKHKIAKQVRNCADISAAWEKILPENILGHAVLQGYNRGTLTVAAQSASKRFQLRTFLSGKGLNQLRKQAGRAINKVRIVPTGNWPGDEGTYEPAENW